MLEGENVNPGMRAEIDFVPRALTVLMPANKCPVIRRPFISGRYFATTTGAPASELLNQKVLYRGTAGRLKHVKIAYWQFNQPVKTNISGMVTG
jgi:hypothetical protein